MKKIFFFLAIVASVSFLTSCGDDDDQMSDDPQYSITINSPNAEDKHVNDDLTINIDMISGSNMTVHHANIRIYNKDDNSIIAYNRADDEEMHVHEDDGNFNWTYTLKLDETNNVTAHSDWILEAKVWGHEAGLAEVVETLEFHVHPE